MSVHDNDPEEAKGITIYSADGTEVVSDSEALDEWFEAFKRADPDQIEMLPPIQATGTEYDPEEADEE